MPRWPLFFTAAMLLVATRAHASGGVLPRSGDADPALLDVRVAVAASDTATTRWSEITIPGNTRVLWLVPARPGAAVDWASDTWLDALDDATALRVSPPSFPTSCPVASLPEVVPRWTASASKRQPNGAAVLTTADDVRALAAQRGFSIDATEDSRIATLYAHGWDLVAFELESSAWTPSSSGTLRVSERGGSPAVLPLALTGTNNADTHVTVFAIGSGVASMATTRYVSPGALTWGGAGSSYADYRSYAVAGGTWLRESAAHAPLFDGTPIDGATPAPAVISEYYPSLSCVASAHGVADDTRVVGTACAEGAVANVPGGTPCVASSGDLSPSTFTCGALDDLALAMSGNAPSATAITRFAGMVPRGSRGEDVPVAFDPTGIAQVPSVRAGSYLGCAETKPSVPPAPVGGGSSSGGGGGGSSGGGTGGTVSYVTTDGCGGSTSSTYEDDSYVDDTTSSSDETDSSDDGCGGDSSSSSSSSSSEDDGWDTSDSSSDDSCTTAKRKRKKSPFSRWAIVAIAGSFVLRRRRQERG